MGAKVQAYQCDVTKRNLVSQLASEVRRDFGDIDMLVNNAGVFNAKEFSHLTEGEIRRTMDVNIFSVFWVSIIYCLSGKLWYLSHKCVGDTMGYHLDSDIVYVLCKTCNILSWLNW